MTRKDSKGGKWGAKRVYDKATGKSKIIRFRIKNQLVLIISFCIFFIRLRINKNQVQNKLH